MWLRLFRSLSFRLLVIFMLASATYVYAARYAVQLFQDTDYLRQIVGAHIALHTDYVLADIGIPPNLERAQAIVDRTPVDIRIVGPDVDWTSTPAFPRIADVPFGKLSLLNLGEANRDNMEAWAQSLERVEFARYQEHAFVKIAQGNYVIVFASPRISEMPAANYSTLFFSVLGLVVLLLCFLAVQWLFRPIRWMQEITRRIGQGELDYRIPVHRRNELGDLTKDINRMADDVQGMLEAKRQLMLAISHELRSPLTRTKVALALLDDEHIKAKILEDVDEMERLITDLLESEALNTRHAILRREQVDLDELVQSVLATEISAGQQNVQVKADMALVGMLDATRIRLLVKNLVENALRYNPPAGAPIEVRLDRQDGVLRLQVQDHGPGIPPEHLAHVTEPFYRADPARSRTTGGFGLGLYLCRRIVEAHGGALTLQSGAGKGTLVTATLPG